MEIFRLEFALQFWRQTYHQELEMKEIHGGDSWEHYRAAIRQAGAQRVQEKELARKMAENKRNQLLRARELEKTFDRGIDRGQDDDSTESDGDTDALRIALKVSPIFQCLATWRERNHRRVAGE
jgi:hypothetical protein